jgi:hypothetical protein
MFFRAGYEETEAVEQTARADANRVTWDCVESDVLDKLGSRSGRFQSRGHVCVSVFFTGHELIPISVRHLQLSQCMRQIFGKLAATVKSVAP